MNLDNLDYLSSFLTGYAKEYFFNIRCVNDESYVPTPRPSIKYDSIVDSRDGHVYRTVKIGNQVWMAENLNFETKNSHCLRDTTTTCDELGRYYDWMTAMDVAGVYSPNGKDCGDNKRCLPTYPLHVV